MYNMTKSERRNYAKYVMKHTENTSFTSYTLYIEGTEAVAITKKYCNEYCYSKFEEGQIEAVLENLVAISYFPSAVSAYKAAKKAKKIFNTTIKIVKENTEGYITESEGIIKTI